ncbi:MAG: hypothetical protein PHW82_08950 [Bacteroidales bacterium]|nr:hypothetical protein [Bacteroidales bacterium]
MHDLILNNDYDLQVDNGDFVVENSEIQHQGLLLLSEKNDFKEFPDRCVGSRRFVESNDSETYAREISQQFNADGMTVHKIIVNIPEVAIEASYES